jgi:hypothetical protein
MVSRQEVSSSETVEGWYLSSRASVPVEAVKSFALKVNESSAFNSGWYLLWSRASVAIEEAVKSFGLKAIKSSTGWYLLSLRASVPVEAIESFSLGSLVAAVETLVLVPECKFACYSHRELGKFLGL